MRELECPGYDRVPGNWALCCIKQNPALEACIRVSAKIGPSSQQYNDSNRDRNIQLEGALEYRSDDEVQYS